MVGTTQVETRPSFEPRIQPVEPTPAGVSDTGAADNTGLQGIGDRVSNGPSGTPSISQNDHAFTIRLSPAAQNFSASDNAGQDTAPQGPSTDFDPKARYGP